MSGRARERVLVCGDDMRIFLSIVRSLGRAGKEMHAAPFNLNAPALRSKYISKVHHFPRYSDDPAAWRAAVLDALRTYSFDLTIPCFDRDIAPFHLHRQDFSGYRIAIPGAEAMSLLFDKELTRELCVELGVPVCKGARVREGDSARDLASRFGLPLALKPRRSYWVERPDPWAKVSIVESVEELEALLAALQDPSRFLVESYFKGAGVGVSVLADDGEILQAFQHRRLREAKGGESSYRISEPVDPELRRACEKICARLAHTGVCMFEFRYNQEARDWVLLETNARFWGSMPLPLSLGVDFPRFLFDLLVHGARHPQADYSAQIRSRNFVLDALNLLAGLRDLRKGGIGPWLAGLGDFLWQPLRWPSGRERSDSFVADDLGPAFWQFALLLKRLPRELSRGRSETPPTELRQRYGER